MATAPSPNDLTRQQLDELDALLQRMLALPLNPPDPTPHPGTANPGSPVLPLPPESVPAAKNWRIDVPAPAVVPAPHLVVPPETPAPPEPVLPDVVTPPAPVAHSVTAPASGSAEVRPQVAPPEPERVVTAAPRVPPPEPEPPRVSVPAPPPAPERKPRPVPAPEPIVPRAAVPQPAPPAVPGPPIPVALWPLIAFNWVIDRLLGLFGPPGWFLRSGFGKNLLGVAGLGLLAYTAVRLAQQQGWVSLPFPLPWPP